jgi:hypothetical protein
MIREGFPAETRTDRASSSLSVRRKSPTFANMRFTRNTGKQNAKQKKQQVAGKMRQKVAPTRTRY